MSTVKLVTLAPGHFHAALVQKAMVRGVDPHVNVYAPLSADLIAHLNHIACFNARPDHPTNWTVDVHAGPDWLDRFLADRPGNAVVIAGRNRPKIDLILAAVEAGYCVLADKPWIVEAADFPKLEWVFAEADRNGVYAWDIMTERFEEATVIQRELIQNPDVFGDALPGTADEPALELESVHYLIKQVAGVPLRRPVWWFDPTVAGEAMADVGTHLADLALWLLFPDEAVDYRKDIEVIAANRWPTFVEHDDFRHITGLSDIPTELTQFRDGTALTYWGNGSTTVRIRNHIVRLTTRWGVRAAGQEGDTHFAVARGSRSTVTVRHEPALGSGPQVFVTPEAGTRPDVLLACGRNHRLVDRGDHIHFPIAEHARTGHESHFAKVLNEFIRHFRAREGIPSCERPNLLAKYYVTTRAVELARS
jgi:predicted dehydrogenase